MFATDTPLPDGASRFSEPEISLTTMAKALARLGLDFDPGSPEDVARVARYVDDLMSDESKAEKLVTALGTTIETRAGGDAHLVEPGRVQPFVPVRFLAEHTPADRDLMSDLPSQSRRPWAQRVGALIARPTAL
jgi:hypothetical protein